MWDVLIYIASGLIVIVSQFASWKFSCFYVIVFTFYRFLLLFFVVLFFNGFMFNGLFVFDIHLHFNIMFCFMSKWLVDEKLNFYRRFRTSVSSLVNFVFERFIVFSSFALMWDSMVCGYVLWLVLVSGVFSLRFIVFYIYFFGSFCYVFGFISYSIFSPCFNRVSM